MMLRGSRILARWERSRAPADRGARRGCPHRGAGGQPHQSWAGGAGPVGEGLSNKQIAQRLCIELATRRTTSTAVSRSFGSVAAVRPAPTSTAPPTSIYARAAPGRRPSPISH